MDCNHRLKSPYHHIINSMEKRTNFIKRVEFNAKRKSLSFQPKSMYQVSQPLQISSQPSQLARSLSQNMQTKDTLSISSIGDFKFIGVFDRKVILTANSKLQLLGFFDLHAVHERIRYEYYSRKLKIEAGNNVTPICFDEDVVQKGGNKPLEVFGKVKMRLIDVRKQLWEGLNTLFHEKDLKTTVWGITMMRNQKGDIIIISSRSILGREFTHQEIDNIMVSIVVEPTRVPKPIDQWIAQFSCKSAYKFNDQLSQQQAQRLITNLSHCTFPWHCVHGRPTISVKSFPSQSSLQLHPL